MAGRGPTPKGDVVRRNKERMEKVENVGAVYGKPLPEGILPDGEAWHPQTVSWWESLRRFPLLKDEPDLGWQFLIDTALMHHTMWTKGRWEFASELRLRVAKYGATPEDRMRLKVKIETSSDRAASDARAASAGTVTDIRDRRTRLTSDAS